MSLEWYERVPKSKDRDSLLAGMGEGKYLGILRTAALRQFKDNPIVAASLQQTSLAAALSTKPGKLRDMESGMRAAPLRACLLYCERMGLPVTVLKRVGKGKLRWNGDTPSEGESPTAIAAPAKRDPLPKPKASAEDSERREKLRAESRVIAGAETSLNLAKLKGVNVRNHVEWNMVAVLSVTPSGVLTIDMFTEGDDSRPSDLLKAGFTGVRLALPQVVVYDFDKKKKVTEVRVATAED